MTIQKTDISIRQAAIIAGVGMLIISILSPFGYAYSILGQIVPENAEATVNKIMASEGLFRIGIGCLLINAILDIVVAWTLFIILHKVNKSISLLSAWFRVAYTAILVVSLSNLLNVLHLINGNDLLTSLEQTQLHTHVMVSINSFYNMWDFGLVIFSIHLVILGYLVYKSGYLPKFLGILLLIAGLGYMHDSFSKIFFTNYKITISEYTFIGEFLLIFWVLRLGIKGFDKISGLKT